MWNCSQAIWSCHVSAVSLPKCWRPSPGLRSRVWVHILLSTQELHCCLHLRYLLLTSRSWPVHACLSAIRKLVYFLVGLKTCSVLYRLFFYFFKAWNFLFKWILWWNSPVYKTYETAIGSSRPQPLPFNAGSEPLCSGSRASGPLFETLRPI